MKTIKLYLSVVTALMMLLMSCEPETNNPLVDDVYVPDQVSNVTVENYAGGAKIKYSIPNDPRILYVLATYTLPNGNIAQAKSSVYKNNLELEGFSQPGEIDVNLFTVTRSEVKSAPVVVKVNPMKAPVHHVFESLTTAPTFGGVFVNFTNPFGGEFVLHIFYKDSTGVWVDYDRLYTDAAKRSYASRGFESKPTDFRLFFTDKWHNSSDTLEVTVTPLFEELFDKSLWKDAALPDDSNVPRYGALSQLWTPGAATYFFIKPDMPGLTLPNWWTIDLGKEYYFGRMHVNNVSHADAWMYGRGTPEKFEIWGSNVKSTNWDDWTMLGEFTCVKPSGTPLGTITQEDRDQALAGDSYDFDPINASFRYVRFKTVKTFGNNLDTYLLELTFYGKAAE